MEDLETICFEIISSVGTARSCYVEAIQKAKVKEFGSAELLMKEGVDFFKQGHQVHRSLVEKEVNGEPVNFSLILMHAEDQLMSADGFKIIAEEMINLYKTLHK